DVVILYIDTDGSAVRQFSEQDLIRQRLFYFFVNEPRHRPGAVTRIETAFRKPFTRAVCQANQRTFFGELAVKLLDKVIDDNFDDTHAERSELTPCIQAIPEFRTESSFDRTFGACLCLGSVSKTDAAR